MLIILYLVFFCNDEYVFINLSFMPIWPVDWYVGLELIEEKKEFLLSSMV